MTDGVDSATINIVGNALRGIAQEMGVNLMRSARSTIIREARDFSCALMDGQGRLVAQAEHAPIQMASLEMPLSACLTRHPLESLRPNDVLFTNDPYQGGQHLQDLIVFLPVFHEGRLVGFAGSVAHHIDIGGGAAGLTLDAAEIYAEGLRFTSMKVRESDFGDDGFVTDIVYSNFREPATSIGDLRAQLAACHIGRERLLQLTTRYGIDEVEWCIDRNLDRSEGLMRSVIQALPDGRYEATDAVDSGVLDDNPITVRLAVVLEGDQLSFDFTGTDPQTSDFLNVPIASTMAAVYSAVMMFAAADGRRIPANEGCYRPLVVNVPLGSFLNPVSPAAVRARMCGAYRTFDACLLALQQADPSRVPALGFNVNTTVGFTHRSPAGMRIFIEDIGGGWGATPESDGIDMLDAPLSNCKITPTEVLEAEHPFLRVTRYEYLPDSGGRGKFRGGLGSVREFEVLESGVEFFAYGDRHRFAPRGASGGEDGTCGSFGVWDQGIFTQLPSKAAVPVQAGQRIQIVVGGGGGYGNPNERSQLAIEADRRNGKVGGRMSGAANE